MKYSILLVISISCMLLGCTQEDSLPVKKVTLFSATKEKIPLYELSIPREYVAYDANNRGRTALIKTAYPGMIAFSPEVKHRFYKENGTWSEDMVRIFIGISDIPEESSGDNPNKNDLGRYILEQRLSNQNIRLLPNPSGINQSNHVKTYGRNNVPDGITYVITQNDGRISSVTCTLESICKGNTGWSGEFFVTYQFSKIHFNEMVDVDKSVINLLDSFNPTPFSGKE
ncbi:MAG: hypothetical protein VYD12_04800 [Pseudomonadota bacterium]|nr:hypothetical protein [Pseudomonadota bacterium]